MLRLQLYQCSSRSDIDFLEYLRDNDFDDNFPQVEWNQYMWEENFNKEWNEEWKGNSNSSDEEVDDD